MRALYCSIRALSFVAALLALPAMAHAVVITGTGPLGSFDADLEVAGNQITVTLTNTSDPDNGGFITAFAFNLPDDGVSDVDLVSTTNDEFKLLYEPDNIDANPYGSFDVGAALDPPGAAGPSWLGGGSPVAGIAPGQEATFVFELSVFGPDPVTDVGIMNLLSNPTGNNDGYSFAVRFRGFEDGGSDKVTGAVVPEPGTLLLLGGGLTALALRRRRSSN